MNCGQKYKLKRYYGLTYEDVVRMYNKQKGQCNICKKPIKPVGSAGPKSNTTPCVDHDHVTGKVRGLLCINCNVMIGQSGDNADLLIKAARYLRKHSKQISV